MLLSRLYPYDRIADNVGPSVQLRLSDGDLKAILSGLKSAGADGVSVRLQATGEGDAPVEIRLDWRSDSAAFACSIEGTQAGLLMHDELAGAVGKPVPENHRTCRVCLCAELDLWRSGVVDVASGFVHVYTQRAGLAALGAYAYLTDVDGSPSLDGLYIELSPGEPAQGALRIPSTPLRVMQGALGFGVEPEKRIDLQDAIDRLSELGNSVAQFQSSVRGGPKLG